MPGIFRDASLRYILFCFHGKVTVIWLYSLDFLKINTLMDRGGRNSGRELSLCLSMHHSIFKTMAQKAIWPCLWVTPPKLVERWNRLHWLSYYKMSTLPQAQLYSSLTWNSWISSSCQQVPSQVHCQSALYCISLPLSILLRVFKKLAVYLLQDQARSAKQRDSRLYFWKVIVEAAVRYRTVLLKMASKEEFLSSLKILYP